MVIKEDTDEQQGCKVRNISSRALAQLQEIAMFVGDQVARKAVQLMEARKTTTISARNVELAVCSVLPGELGNTAAIFAKQHVRMFNQ